ncbi:hypothetical protein SXCC_02760 [Gluconacetobacter sp. SXCC-1]|nr:hypothetical protein SXCC_02760 [Gluconacetobacter sp. SXCC-1]
MMICHACGLFPIGNADNTMLLFPQGQMKLRRKLSDHK